MKQPVSSGIYFEGADGPCSSELNNALNLVTLNLSTVVFIFQPKYPICAYSRSNMKKETLMNMPCKSRERRLAQGRPTNSTSVHSTLLSFHISNDSRHVCMFCFNLTTTHLNTFKMFVFGVATCDPIPYSNHCQK